MEAKEVKHSSVSVVKKRVVEPLVESGAKPALRVVAVGPQSAGKSTVIGQLIASLHGGHRQFGQSLASIVDTQKCV